MRYLKTVTIPQAGGAERLFPRISEAQVKVSLAFRKFVGGTGFSFALRAPLTCSIYRAEHGGELNYLLSRCPSGNLSREQVCAVLLYLATDGWSLLDIPAGKEETMIVIGYIVIGDVRMVLYLEHEMEEGRPEEVHIHLAGVYEQFLDEVLVLQIT
jgi:hypothetical protein